MTTRVRLIVLLARPAVIMLLLMFADVGLAQTGHGEDPAALAKTLTVVTGFLLFSVACNDLADEEIDRVNLPGKRPLAAGMLSRREFAVIGVCAGLIALVASVLLGWPAVGVTATSSGSGCVRSRPSSARPGGTPRCASGSGSPAISTTPCSKYSPW